MSNYSDVPKCGYPRRMMDLGSLKRHLQSHFTDGLVTIVGSGLSAAEGIPGMSQLADHLREAVPRVDLDDESRQTWSRVALSLSAGENLENALQSHPPTTRLETEIRLQTRHFLIPAELQVFQKVLGQGHILRFTRLLKAMLKANRAIPVITTNYDRLIELATERAGLSLDTLFVGVHSAHFDDHRSRSRLRTIIRSRRKSTSIDYEDHVLLLKPHGSFDWFLDNSETPVSCQLPMDLPGLIITPGANKFRSGYNRPFDSHRERANKEIDRAARFMIIGYGFGDDHLETHLSSGIRAGKPGLVLTMTLDNEVQDQLLRTSPGITLITSHPSGGAAIRRGTDLIQVKENWWDLGVFITEVLEP